MQQVARFITLAPGRPINARHAVPARLALTINGLIGGDRIEPRPKPSPFIKVVALEVDLHEGRLEYILRHFGVAQVSAQIGVKLALVAAHEFSKEFAITTLSKL